MNMFWKAFKFNQYFMSMHRQFLLLECLIEEKNKYKDWLAPMKALNNSKDWHEAPS